MSPAAAETALTRNYAECDRIARAGDHDRWLAALFAPERLRPHLHAIAAFACETGRIGERVREPLAGEIRLAWWREALMGLRPAEAAGNPVAAALIDTIARFALPIADVVDLLEALTFDVNRQDMASVAELETYGRATAGALIAMAARVLAEGRETNVAQASDEAGAGLALTRALLEFAGGGETKFLPRPVRERGRDGLVELVDAATARFEAAEARLTSLPGEVAPAFAPLATARLELRRWRRSGAHPFRAAASWRRQWALWIWLRRR
ncbi:MAG: squalene synthase [Bradyrhizobium sp.]|nr:MAG: squalene synthase [Bradyrhizobium sp.]